MSTNNLQKESGAYTTNKKDKVSTESSCGTGCGHDHHTDDVTQYVRVGDKVGRNDPCPCGSGKKSKKCCVA